MQKHLLIIDEEPAILEILSATFVPAGYRVTSTNNGFATLCALAKLDQPDLVIVGDLSPRPETSLCLVNDIQDGFTGAKFPIIMLSTQCTSDDVRLGLAVGADRYIAKPFSPSKLLVLVNDLITKRAA